MYFLKHLLYFYSTNFHDVIVFEMYTTLLLPLFFVLCDGTPDLLFKFSLVPTDQPFSILLHCLTVCIFNFHEINF